jgi:hypothetical protein
MEVVGAALRDPGTAAARQTARRGPGGRPRCCAPRCLACSTLALPVTSSCTRFRPSTLAAAAAHHPATSPRGPIDQDAAVEPQDQLGQRRRDAVIDVLQLLPSTMLGQPRMDGLLIRAAWTSPATAGLPTVPGVAALLRIHPSQHQLRLVPGALPPSSPTAFWPLRAAVVAGSCGRSLVELRPAPGPYAAGASPLWGERPRGRPCFRLPRFYVVFGRCACVEA